MHVPLFPLNAVIFPGVTLPLQIFEQRYRDMVAHLTAIPDPAQRVFAIVAIREGYEVGSHEARSLYRVGTLMQVTAADQHADGRYSLECVGRSRIRVEGIDPDGAFVIADIAELTEAADGDAAAQAARTLGAFETYWSTLSEIQGVEIVPGQMPRDPELLSYALAATAVLSLRQRQTLLEATATSQRLQLLRAMLWQEIEAMRTVPSLPATELARTGWSPN